MRAPEGRVKEEITPRGDGNLFPDTTLVLIPLSVKEEITPRGDGNLVVMIVLVTCGTLLRKR